MNKFKIYEFGFKGMYFGGTLIVVSKSKEEATKIARKRVNEMGFEKQEIKCEGEHSISEGVIVHENNGDY